MTDDVAGLQFDMCVRACVRAYVRVSASVLRLVCEDVRK